MQSDSEFAFSIWHIFVSTRAIMTRLEHFCSILLEDRVFPHPYASGDDAARIDDVPRLLPLEAHSLEPQLNPHHERRWWILGALILAQMMVVLDATVVNIALPSAQAALGFNNDDRQWIVTAYSLTFGSLLLLGGKLSDILGRKRTLMIGLLGFAAASAIGGAAQSFLMLAASCGTGCLCSAARPLGPFAADHDLHGNDGT